MFKTERKIFLFVVFRQQDSTAIPFLNIIKNFIKSPHYLKNFIDYLAILKIVIKIKSLHFIINAVKCGQLWNRPQARHKQSALFQIKTQAP
jgi:hypothetical protein